MQSPKGVRGGGRFAISVPPGRLGLAVFQHRVGLVVIEAVHPGCPVEGDVKAGDIIASIDHKDVSKVEDLLAGADRTRRFAFRRPAPAAVEALLRSRGIVPPEGGDGGGTAAGAGEDGGDEEGGQAERPTKEAPARSNAGVLEAAWNKKYDKLKEFMAEHGDCHIPLGNNLRNWADYQRKDYRDGKLHPDRIKKLDAVGFEWKLRLESSWDSRYAEMKEFIAEHGHSNVPSTNDLRKWVDRQRKNYLDEKLPLDRIEMLDAIGFQWTYKDAVWELRYQALVEYKKTHGHCDVRQNNYLLGTWIRDQRGLYKKKQLRQDQIKMLNDIDFSWDRFATRWESRLQQIIEFAEQNGHCKVPSTHKAYAWLRHQEEMYKTGRLPQERIDRLEGIGFVFGERKAWNKKSLNAFSNILARADSAWNDWYAKLQEYHAEHGHSNVPQLYSVPQTGERLGAWANRQRSKYNDGSLKPSRAEMLEAVGFRWEVREAAKEAAKGVVWELQFQQLVEFKEKNGHCSVQYDDEQLGEWVRCQRKSYEKKELQLDRIEMLESIGFSWNTHDADWDDQFQKYVEFKGSNGKCNAGVYKKLTSWVDMQRAEYKSGKLLQDRIDRLESVGFVWDMPKTEVDEEGMANRNAKEEAWQLQFQQLVEFKKKHGHCRVPDSSNDQLGEWVRYQREWYKDGELRPDRMKKLQGIGFSWNCHDADWDDQFQKFVAFKRKNGRHCDAAAYKKLTFWVNLQRKNHKSGKLGQERIDRLESVGFVWEKTKTDIGKSLDVKDGGKKNKMKGLEDANLHEVAWEVHFQEIVAFKRKHGHCRVPYRSGLGPWMNRQRKHKKIKKLRQDRLKKLEDIGFCWNPQDAAWDDQFQNLVAFKEKNEQHYNAAVHKNLTQWVDQQRKRYKSGTLPQERIDRLESIDFVWAIRKTKFGNWFGANEDVQV